MFEYDTIANLKKFSKEGLTQNVVYYYGDEYSVKN
jgi:hypothetical protein